MCWKKNGRKHPRSGTKKPRSYFNSKKKKDRFEIKKKLILKFGNACKRCAEKNLPYAVYQFHHIGEKTKEIGRMMNNTKWEEIEKEAEKCIMLCANCHIIEHHGTKRVE